MAKLVNRNEVVMIIEREKNINTLTEWGKGFMDGLNTVEENLVLLPTTTEAEIRNRAIEEFAGWCYVNGIDFAYMHKSTDTAPFVKRVVDRFIAEQLKEE